MASAPLPAKIVISGISICIAALLIALAVPRFLQGLRTEPFHGVVNSAMFGDGQPASTYRAAAEAFADTSSNDGEGLAEWTQALLLTDENDSKTLSRARDLVVQSLLAAPSNPTAWLLLCQIEVRRTQQAAVACLDYAYAIAPYDWYTAGRRLSLVATEWPYLDERLRDHAVSLVLPMWNSTGWSNGLTLNGALYDLTATDNGRQLLMAGFGADPEALRSFNRFVIKERADGH